MATYNPKTRVANWSEDIELREAQLKDFLRRRETGDLPSMQAQRRRERHLCPVGVSPQHADGALRFGDRILLHNDRTDHFLSVDMNDSPDGMPEAVEVTAAPAQAPAARNVFRLEPAEGDVSASEGRVICYGDKFMLCSVDELSDTTYRLHSQRASVTSFARVSHHLEICMHPRRSFDCAWECVYADPAYRLELEGDPVQANASVLLRHCFSRELLAAEDCTFRNEYGFEHEVSGHTFRDTRRRELDNNMWGFVYAPPEETAGGEGAADAEEGSGEEVLP